MQYLRPFISLLTWSLLILVLPALGVWLGGHPLGEYLRFPLVQPAWDPLPFAARVYWTYLGLTAIGVLLIGWFSWSTTGQGSTVPPTKAGHSIPLWGWLGLAGLNLGVFLGILGHPFPGQLLFSYSLLLLVNADTLRRTGHCLMTERPGYFLALFGGGLLAGWLMHYLNLFLQSWHYPGLEHLDSAPAALLLLLAYLPLLPLLLSLRQWLASFPSLLRPLMHGSSLPASQAPDQGWLLLGVGVMALAGAGLWPDQIYPLTWLAPLLIALGITLLSGQATLFSGLRHGDWSRPLLTALAALLLGVIDRAWNSLFEPLWQPSLSQLQGPALLGLPLPAFAQYLVFGLIGLWVADQLIKPWQARPRKRFPAFPVRIAIK